MNKAVNIFERNMKEHSYRDVWREIAEILEKNMDANIMVVNCGVGYLVKYLLDEGFSNVFGIDVHLELIQKGRELCPALDKRLMAQNFFRLSDADKNNYDIYIFVKTLEYQENADKYLGCVPIGAKILAAFPNYDDGLALKSFHSKSDMGEYMQGFIKLDFVQSVALFKNAEFLIDQAVLLAVGEKKASFIPAQKG